MITVKTSCGFSDLILECDARIAGDVLYTLAQYNPTTKTTNDNKCIVCVDMKHINNVNQDLAKYKGKLIIDKSFLEWKQKYAGKTPVLIKVGVNYSKLYKSPNYEIPHTKIENVCKYFFTPAVNQKAYKDKKWDGYIHLYKKWLHQFPTGLMDRVLEVLDKEKIPYTVDYTYEQKPPRQFTWVPKDIFTLSEDQVECIDECMEAGRCVVKAATGFGKRIALY